MKRILFGLDLMVPCTGHCTIILGMEILSYNSSHFHKIIVFGCITTNYGTSSLNLDQLLDQLPGSTWPFGSLKIEQIDAVAHSALCLHLSPGTRQARDVSARSSGHIREVPR